MGYDNPLQNEREGEYRRYKGLINQPCSACSAGDTKMEYHDHEYVKPENRRGPTVDETMLVDVLLLCTECQQPIRARINTPQWIRCEWIGPSGECQACYTAKREQGKESGDE